MHALDRETEKKKKTERDVHKMHRACIECFLKRRTSDEAPVTESSIQPMMSELDAESDAGGDAAGMSMLSRQNDKYSFSPRLRRTARADFIGMGENSE